MTAVRPAAAPVIIECFPWSLSADREPSTWESPRDDGVARWDTEEKKRE